jgi:Enoyl-(Acyl carrier protein) reductase
MAQALAPRIRVNAVGPGPTLASSRQRQDDFARQGASVPLGHGPRPEEIAEAVLFLANAKSVTGQMLAVDGGQHLAWETPDVLAAAEQASPATYSPRFAPPSMLRPKRGNLLSRAASNGAWPPHVCLLRRETCRRSEPPSLPLP